MNFDILGLCISLATLKKKCYKLDQSIIYKLNLLHSRHLDLENFLLPLQKFNHTMSIQTKIDVSLLYYLVLRAMLRYRIEKV